MNLITFSSTEKNCRRQAHQSNFFDFDSLDGAEDAAKTATSGKTKSRESGKWLKQLPIAVVNLRLVLFKRFLLKLYEEQWLFGNFESQTLRIFIKLSRDVL